MKFFISLLLIISILSRKTHKKKQYFQRSVVPAQQMMVNPVAHVVRSVPPMIHASTTMVNPIAPIVRPVAPVVSPVAPIVSPVAPIVNPIVSPAAPIVSPAAPIVSPAVPIVSPVAPIVNPIVSPVAPIVSQPQIMRQAITPLNSLVPTISQPVQGLQVNPLHPLPVAPVQRVIQPGFVAPNVIPIQPKLRYSNIETRSDIVPEQKMIGSDDTVHTRLQHDQFGNIIGQTQHQSSMPVTGIVNRVIQTQQVVPHQIDVNTNTHDY